MTNQDEFTTRIDIDYDPSGLEEASQDLEKHAETTREAGETADRTTRRFEQQTSQTRDTGKASKETASQLDRQARETREAGDASQRATTEMREQSDATGRMAGAVQNVVARWLAFTAIAGAVVQWLKDIAKAAREATEATVDHGRAIRDLVNNLGAVRGRQVSATVDALAVEQRMNPEEREMLRQSAVAITSVSPNMNDEQLGRQLRTMARLQVITGEGGESAVELVRAIQASTNLNYEHAADMAAAVMTGPIDANTATELLQRGGPEALSLALAAAPESIRPSRFTEQVPAITQRLRDLSDEDRQKLGLEESMGLTPSLIRISERIDSGALDETTAFDALGGAESADVLRPLMKVARDSDRIHQVQRELLARGRMETMLRELRSDPNFRAMERESLRKLEKQLQDEGSGLGGLGEALREAEHQLERNRLSWVPGGEWGFVLGQPGITSPEAMELEAEHRQRGLRKDLRGQGIMEVDGDVQQQRAGAAAPGQTIIVNDNRQIIHGTNIEGRRDPRTGDLHLE